MRDIHHCLDKFGPFFYALTCPRIYHRNLKSVREEIEVESRTPNEDVSPSKLWR